MLEQLLIANNKQPMISTLLSFEFIFIVCIADPLFAFKGNDSSPIISLTLNQLNQV